MNKISDPLRDAWSSLGIAFNAQSGLDANPEQTIIATLKSNEFPNDRKIFELMLLWLNEYKTLVHIESLKHHMCSLKPFEVALLGGIAAKCVQGDLRWNAIIKESKHLLGNHPPSFEKGDDELYIKMKGLDEEFFSFGISVAKTVGDDRKKLLSRERTIKMNTWLRHRLLLGANLRADFITLFKLKLASNAYQAAKVLNCSLNASYRNWRDIEEAMALGIIL